MITKKWVVRNQVDPQKIEVISVGGFIPKNAVLEFPEAMAGEDPAWLEVVEIPDPDDPNYVIDVLRVNQTKKTAVLAARTQEETNFNTRLDQLRTLRAALRNIRDTDAANLAQANARLKTLATACLAMFFIVLRDDQ